MTQTLINTYFLSELGIQCNSLFSTNDDRVFTRAEEARAHADTLSNKEIVEWFEEWSGADLYPSLRNHSLGLDIDSDDYAERNFH